MANKQMKRWSTSLDVREVQLKTTVRYARIPVRIAKIRENDDDNTNCCPGRSVGKRELPYMAGGDVRGTQVPRGVQAGGP